MIGGAGVRKRSTGFPGWSALGANVERLLRTYREEIVEKQYQQGRVADAAIELYVSSCVLRRLDALLGRGDENGEPGATHGDLIAGRYYLRSAERRIRQALANLWDNDDELTTQAANSLLP